jgi:acetylglutamate kinase
MLTVLKLGGELLEDDAAMRRAAAGVARLLTIGPLAVVHGGGRAIDADLRARGRSPHFVDGLRVTDESTLESVVSVLAGRINTAFVATLGTCGRNAVGLTGADAAMGAWTLAPALQTRTGGKVDLGLVGVPVAGKRPRLVQDLVALDYVPVIASVGADAKGALLNVNADVYAAWLAVNVSADQLIIAGSTPGVYDERGATCDEIDETKAAAMIASGAARDGMVAKLTAALDAIRGGVPLVRIVDGRGGEYAGSAGTTITRDENARYESPDSARAQC